MQGERKNSGENKRAKVLWALKEAKDGGDDFYDASHGKEINWSIFLKNPTAACGAKSVGCIISNDRCVLWLHLKPRVVLF